MKLKEYRIKNGYTQKDIAKILNKTVSCYGFYENGRNEPDISTLTKLAELYNITIDELIGREQLNVIDKGTLNKNELDIIDKMKQLTAYNQEKLLGYTYAIWQNQQDEQTIIRKIKGE